MTLRHADGTFASGAPEAIYAEVRRIDDLAASEAKRLDQLRSADQLAVTAALSAAEKAVAAALVASEKAVNKAEAAQGQVNATQNEFRGTLRDQAETFLPRAEYLVSQREIQASLDRLSLNISELRSRIDVGPTVLPGLQAQANAAAGFAAGKLDNKTALYAVILAAAAIIGILLNLSKLVP